MSDEENSQEEINEMPPNLSPSLLPQVSKEVQDVMQLRNLLENKRKGGELSIIEYLMMSDFLDRREERNRNRDNREKNVPTITYAEIRKIIKEEMNPPSAEPSEEVKILTERVEKMEQEKQEREQKERDQNLIKEATEPLKAEIEKRNSELEDLKERVKSLSNQRGNEHPTSNTFTDKVQEVVNVKKSLEELGLIKEDRGGATITMSGPDGMPIKGEIPGWAVWVPWMIKEIKEPLTEVIADLGKRMMLTGISGAADKKLEHSSNKLINLPTRPKIEVPPAPKPEMPKIAQSEHLINLPKTPQIQTPEPSDEVTVKHTEDILKKMKMPDLWKIATSLKLPKTGTKNHIITRILEAEKNE